MKIDSVFKNSNLIYFKEKLKKELFENFNNNVVNFIKSNEDLLKNRNKKVIEKTNLLFNRGYFISKLNELWNVSFIEGTLKSNSNFNLEAHLTKFKAVDKEQNVQEIQRRKIYEKNKLQQLNAETNIPISDSEFGKLYLQNRNEYVYDNFSSSYKQRIRNGISKYLKSRITPSQYNERILVNSLSFKDWTKY